MKITEIMIGDWVKINCFDQSTIKVKVSVIEESRIVGNSVSGSSHWGNIKDISPIPLTPEILEKNGWECVGEEERCPIMKVYDGPDAFWWTNRKGECGCERSVDRGGEEWIKRTFICYQVCYVHELQHALRLCGIEKELKIEG